MTDLQDVKVNGEDLLPDSGRNWSPDVLLERCYDLGIWGVLLLRFAIKATILRGSTASVKTELIMNVLDLYAVVSYLVNRKYVYTGWKVGKPQHICSDFNMRSIFHKRLESV
ncbi:hypothetical protein GN244_ATG11161 [Phytophthora infestans]|uniref:Uncharacterized protein n=1 Tax=Phytophthora infestans TaxID=4787 RepID=A0A833SRR9_PHYIN|nr:hypothetical protein GN244_ATG11161 [Phytophthora infestans]